MIGDKGLIRPELTEALATHGLQLHTPLRVNMKDSRQNIMNIHRRIETVIGQLVERFKIQIIRTKTIFHASVKIARFCEHFLAEPYKGGNEVKER